MSQDILISDIIHKTTSIWMNTLDNQGNIVIWNRAAEQISGYLYEEVVGHSGIWQKLYPDPSYRELIFNKAQDIINSNRSLADFESAIITKSGKQVILSWNSHNLINDRGEVVGSIAIARDITKRRNERLRLQNALRETQENLSQTEQICEVLRYGNTESLATLHHTIEQLAQSQLDSHQRALVAQAEHAIKTLMNHTTDT